MRKGFDMPNPVIFLFGYKKIRARIEDAAELFNICSRHSIVYRNQKSDEGAISLELSLPYAKRLEKLCSEEGITLISIEEFGFPSILYRYRRRYGIALGLLLSIVISLLLRSMVWDIRIEGKLTNLTHEEIIRQLDVCGIRVGSPIRNLDTDVIQNRVLIYSDDISWISINLIGTVAHVEVREAVPPPEDKEQIAAANLVATEDGVIEGFEEVRGEISVRIGDTVREGELLVSGIRESKTQGFTYTPSSGKVYARCESEYFVEIPLSYEEKIPTGRIFFEKFLIFFNKEIKIFSNINKMRTNYDIIDYNVTDTVNYTMLDSTKKLPISIRTVRYVEYEKRDAMRTGEEAISLAFIKLSDKEKELGVSDVISKQLEGELGESSYILRARSVSVKNIAKQVIIEVENK